MSSLYLTEEGSSLHLKDNRFVIKKSDNILKEVCLEKIDNIVLMGNTHLTSPLTVELLERDIPVTWLSSAGRFFGRLEPTKSVNIERQREQFRRSDDLDFSLKLSKIFITAKIKNCQVVLRRYNRNFNYESVSDIIAELKRYAFKVNEASDVEQLLGFEGNASKIYFKGLGRMVRSEFSFDKRTKMPPTDKFNSLLSFGYTLLMYEIYTAIVNKGLNPYCSYLHKVRRGHPALASDMIEEWRAVLVDSLVMGLVQTKAVTEADFQPQIDGGAVYLTKSGIKKFILKFEERLNSDNAYLDSVDYPMSFRQSIQFQAGAIVKAIENNDPEIYKAINIR